MKTSTSSPRVWTVAETPVAELEHVCFSYDGERVLDEVSLRIARGDFLGIIGPNGAGKTTLLRIGLGRRFAAPDYEAARRALETVGMLPFRDRLIGQLSSGQQQRVLIARALVSHPDLLVLDEPTVGVDADAQEQFYSLLHRLNREMGTTLVLVSHDIGVISQEVTQLACLNRTLVFHGSPEEAMRSGALAEMYRAQSWMVAHRH